MSRGTTTPEGIVLLEVICALVLFVAAAAVVLGTLNQSMQAAERLALDAEAADLLVTVDAWTQVGLIDPQATGVTPFAEPHDHWSYEVLLDEADVIEGLPVQQQTVRITHNPTQTDWRLSRLVPIDEPAADDPFGFGGDDFFSGGIR